MQVKPTIADYGADSGRWYEDFTVGDLYQHLPGRTILESDNAWFTLLTMNTHPLHFDRAYAEQTEFGQVVVSSTLTLAMVVGMSVRDVSQKSIANLGWTNIELVAPVFVNDTIYARSLVTHKRLSNSRPGQGVVSVKTTGLKRDGTIFMTFERTILVPCRPA